MKMLPLGNAARATRTVSSGTASFMGAGTDMTNLLDRHSQTAIGNQNTLPHHTTPSALSYPRRTCKGLSGSAPAESVLGLGQVANATISLGDTSPPWYADAALPECGHYWRHPRDSERP